MRKNSTFRYLLYLSVFDLLVLVVGATDAYLRFGFNLQIRNYSSYLCRYHTFFTYFLTHASSIILMIVNVDRAFVVHNKSFFFNILRLRKYEKLEKREVHSCLCGISLCCLIHCGISSSPIGPIKRTVSLHRVDRVIALVLVTIALLNIHYIFLMNIHSYEYSDFVDTIQNTTNITSILSYSQEEISDPNLDLIIFVSKQMNDVCYPAEGKQKEYRYLP